MNYIDNVVSGLLTLAFLNVILRFKRYSTLVLRLRMMLDSLERLETGR